VGTENANSFVFLNLYHLLGQRDFSSAFVAHIYIVIKNLRKITAVKACLSRNGLSGKVC